MPPLSTKREFCRRLFRVGGSSASARQSFLDGLADAALSARQTGKTLIGVSSEGTSSSFALFDNWQPDELLELIDAARTWAAAANIAAALVLIGTTKRNAIYSDFSRARV